MIAHIAKRIGLIALGYVAAMMVSVVVVWRVSLFTGPTSYYWTDQGMLVGPEYTAFMLSITDMLILPLLPTLIFILAAEFSRWRRLWIYLVGWTLVIVSVTFLVSLSYSPATTIAASLSALLGGFIYWAIAGRSAGFRREEVSAQSVPS